MNTIISTFISVLSLATFSAFSAHAAGPAPIPEQRSVPAAPAAAAPAAPAPAAPEASDDATPAPSAATSCSARMGKYVYKGSLTSKKVGARTWKLSQLAAAARKDSDPCAKSLLKRALKEETAYWDHIRKVHHCSDDYGKLSTSATCSEHLLAAVKQNLAWMKLRKFAQGPDDEDNGTQGAVCDEKCKRAKASEPLSETQLRNARDVVRATTASLPDGAHVGEGGSTPKPPTVTKKPAPGTGS